MFEGKAKLIRDDYCDGLGDCLPACPTGAISFVEREAAAYDEQAVKEAQALRASQADQNDKAVNMLKPKFSYHCPGMQTRRIERQEEKGNSGNLCNETGKNTSRLSQWPVQIKLASVNAPYFNGAKLLIAADCTAYAYGNFHERFIKGRITLIGCPKLDSVDYSEKLAAIIKNNDIKDVTVVRMEVPCCGGIEMAVKNALIASGKMIPWQVVTITTDGREKE